MCWGRQKWPLVLVSQVTDRAVTYTRKSWKTIFRIWRKHMGRNATNLDKNLKFQTWRGRRALNTHFWITLTSVLPQTKYRILYVRQESHKYPQAVASNYKENIHSWRGSSLQRVVKSLGQKWRECIWYYVLCTLFYFICILLLLLTRRSAHFNTNHSESSKVIQISYVHPS